MTRGSRSNLMAKAAGVLQGAFQRRRNAHRTGFEALSETGAFKAPAHLAPALQGDLGLAAALAPDTARAEAG